MNLYITHCTKIKDDSLNGKDIEVTPDKLYIGKKIQRFMKKCKDSNVKWAIFSDFYGVWFSDVKHKWYGNDAGDPNKVTAQKFCELVKESEERLNIFDKIFFYANYKSPYFHHLYKELIEELKSKGLNIVLISHLADIKNDS